MMAASLTKKSGASGSLSRTDAGLSHRGRVFQCEIAGTLPLRVLGRAGQHGLRPTAMRWLLPERRRRSSAPSRPATRSARSRIVGGGHARLHDTRPRPCSGSTCYVLNTGRLDEGIHAFGPLPKIWQARRGAVDQCVFTRWARLSGGGRAAVRHQQRRQRSCRSALAHQGPLDSGLCRAPTPRHSMAEEARDSGPDGAGTAEAGLRGAAAGHCRDHGGSGGSRGLNCVSACSGSRLCWPCVDR